MPRWHPDRTYLRRPFPASRPSAGTPHMDYIQVDIIGLSTSPSSGGAYALVLGEVSGNRRLPIIIAAFEAQAIALELEKIQPPRPMTHDLLRNLFDSLGADVTDVVIDDLREGTFFAKVGCKPAYGARGLGRVVQKHGKKPVADEILFGELSNGGHAEVDYVDGKVILRVVRKSAPPVDEKTEESVD